MKKFILVISTILTIITCTCNVFAEEEIIEEEKEELVEELNENEIEEINEQENINNTFTNNINEINSKLTLLGNNINSLSEQIEPGNATGNFGLAIDFNFRWKYIFNKYLELKDQFDVIAVEYDGTYGNMYMYFMNKNDNSQITYNPENNSYTYTNFDNEAWLGQSGGFANYGLPSHGTKTITCFLDRIYNGTRGWTAFYKICNENGDNIYFLYPYTLNIFDNTDVTISTYNFDEQIYYSNQLISVTSNSEEFYAWIDTDNMEELTKNPTYTFNIDHNTNLRWLNEIQYKELFPNENNNNIDLTTIEYSLFILIGYLFIKGALIYDR